MTIAWTGHCPECGEQVGMWLTPTDEVVNSLLPDPDRLTRMFDIEVRCQNCEKRVEPQDLQSQQK